MTDYGYEIEAHAAGGWRVHLLKNGEEVGCGVYPADASSQSDQDAAYEDALAEATAWLAQDD